MPDRIDTSVDLPAPLRPTRPRHRPGCRLRSTPRSACVLPKCLWMPAASTAGAGEAAALHTPPCWVPYTLPHSVASLTEVVETVPDSPSTGLTVRVWADLVTNGATI